MKKIQKKIDKQTLSPYCFILKNNTESKLENVKLFDFEHEKQDKISYMCGTGEITYNDILRILLVEKAEIYFSQIIPKCDYEKYRMRQLQCGIEVHSLNGRGEGLFQKFQFIIDSKAINFTTSRLAQVGNFTIGNIARNPIYINYIMPETEIIIYFYPN